MHRSGSHGSLEGSTWKRSKAASSQLLQGLDNHSHLPAYQDFRAKIIHLKNRGYMELWTKVFELGSSDIGSFRKIQTCYCFRPQWSLYLLQSVQTFQSNFGRNFVGIVQRWHADLLRAHFTSPSHHKILYAPGE